jgi:hypothetical protein
MWRISKHVYPAGYDPSSDILFPRLYIYSHEDTITMIRLSSMRQSQRS